MSSSNQPEMPELPGMIYDPVRRKYFKKPPVGQSLSNPFGPAASTTKQKPPSPPPSSSSSTAKQGKRIRSRLLHDTELGIEQITASRMRHTSKSEHKAHAIMTGNRVAVQPNHLTKCEHRSPCLKLRKQIWPSVRKILFPRHDLEVSEISYDMNESDAAVCVLKKNGGFEFYYNPIITYKYPLQLESYGYKCLTGPLFSVSTDGQLACLQYLKERRPNKLCTLLIISRSFDGIRTRIFNNRLSSNSIRNNNNDMQVDGGGGGGGGGGGRAELLDRNVDDHIILRKHGDVTCVRWTNDGKVLCGFRSGSISLVDAREQKMNVLLPSSTQSICDDCRNVKANNSIADIKQYNDNQIVISTLYNNALGIWDLRKFNKTPMIAFDGHVNECKWLKIDVAGGMLAGGGDDNCVRIWDCELGGSPIACLSNFNNPVEDVRIGTVDKYGGWAGGLWTKLANSDESYICGLLASTERLY